MIVAMLIFAGLALGSFVNALVWRLHAQDRITDKKKQSKADKARLKRLSITKGRSMCMACGHELASKDLIPIVSWLWLRGKCRYCGARIPDTPVSEVVVPVLLVVSYLWWPWSLVSNLNWLLFGLWAICIVSFVALALYDLRWYLLPNRIVFPLIGVALAFRLLVGLQADTGQLSLWLCGVWGAALLAGLFYLLFIISNEQWIGGGDVKLAVALGLLAGGPLATLLLLFLASTTGTLAAVPLLLQGKSIRHMRIPFGPFLILATILTVLFSQSVIDWYIGLFSLTNHL
jgi:prepilin signal peptidase PulO-like enzyme (type II secretory pathway)